jgi:hypothetical protein
MQSNILEKLKDDKEYYGGIGKNYVSNSDISTLLFNPQNFGKDREKTAAMVKGSYLHHLILEPTKAESVQFVDASTRNTKLYKEYIKESEEDIVLLKSEKELMEELSNIMTMKFDFYEKIFNENSLIEQPFIKEHHGVMWKGKADIVNHTGYTNEHEQLVTYAIDIKTTSDINRFSYSASKFNYDSQAYLYKDGFGVDEFWFFVICTTNKVCGMFKAEQSFLERGAEKVRRASENYLKYFGKDKVDDPTNFYIEGKLF